MFGETTIACVKGMTPHLAQMLVEVNNWNEHYAEIKKEVAKIHSEREEKLKELSKITGENPYEVHYKGSYESGGSLSCLSENSCCRWIVRNYQVYSIFSY